MNVSRERGYRRIVRTFADVRSKVEDADDGLCHSTNKQF